MAMDMSLGNDAIILTVPRDQLPDADAFLSKEWLVTNGLGGYASSTLLGAPTRRYHGLFVPDLPAPWGRTVLMPRFDEEVIADGESLLISGVEYEDGRLVSDLPRLLTEFSREWQTPVWRMAIRGRHLEKRIIMPRGRNTVYVEYRLLEGKPLQLRLRPFLAFRKLDAKISEGEQPAFPPILLDGRFELWFCEDAPPLRMCIRPPDGHFVEAAVTSRGVCYRVDRDRGSECIEDLSSPGYFTVELTPDRPVSFVASTESWDQLEYEAQAIVEAEVHRLSALLAHVDESAEDGMERWLTLAADQFIVIPASRVDTHALHSSGDKPHTIIAGYHWFTDWGRDTMISLEGLTLCTGRYQEARSILRTFGRYVRDGLLPNLFPEGQRQALYHTVDATLWYFHALDRYYRTTGDRETLRVLHPVLVSVIDHHVKGTHFGIKVDQHDGLLYAGADGYQLTWMDAKVGDWVVTPRRGKPVEIQALWYNALCCMADWGPVVGEPSERWTVMASHAAQSFNRRFWDPKLGYLLDVVDGELGDDSSLRPNQILAISLPHPILEEVKWRPVIDVVADRLLTPVGLRSLDPAHRDYKRTYFGDLRARDAAYHQGTVWAWLIGPFIDAWLKIYGDLPQGRRMLEGFRAHLLDGGIGTISEIFDAEHPYYSRGCIAQAWSVAEVLRVWRKTRKRD